MEDENMTTPANNNVDSAQSVKSIPTSGTITDPIAPSKPPEQPSSGNTSGQGSNAVVPEEVKGWSWGGFFLTWIWGIGNNVWIALLALVPVPMLPFIMAIVLGVKGRELAWQSKHWDNVEHFKKTQRKWSIAGIIIGILLLLVIPIILVLIVVVAINPAERIREVEEQQQQLQQQNQLQQEENIPSFEFPE